MLVIHNGHCIIIANTAPATKPGRGRPAKIPRVTADTSSVSAATPGDAEPQLRFVPADKLRLIERLKKYVLCLFIIWVPNFSLTLTLCSILHYDC